MGTSKPILSKIDPKTDRTFIEEIDDPWRLDGIELRQHETEGWFGCFGCSTPKADTPALCIDPALEMKQVAETKDRYCNENFEVVEKENSSASKNE